MVAFVRRSECVPQTCGSSPIATSQSASRRAYCRVVMLWSRRRPSNRHWPRFLVGCRQILIDRLPGLLGELESYRPTGLSLAHGCPLYCMAVGGDVIDPDGDQVTSSQLAVDGEIEQRQLSHLPLDLKPGSYGPDMPLPQGCSGSDQFAFIPGDPLRGGGSWDFVLVHGRTPPLLTVDDHA